MANSARTRRSRRAAHGRRGRAAVALRAAARHGARGAGLARHPGARRAGSAAWGGPRPRRRRAIRPQAREGGPALRRPRVGGQLGVPPRDADVSVARRGGRRAGHRRRRRLARRAPGAVRGGQRARRARADELPVVEPDGAQGHDRRGRRQPRARSAPPRVRRLATAAPAGDGRHEQVRGRREPGPDAGLRGAAHRRLRAHPLRAADRAGARGAAALRPADDQQVLRARPRARPQHDRAPARAGPAGVLDLLAQPGRGAGPLRPRHLRARGARGARRRGRDHAWTVDRPPERGVLGRDHHRRAPGPPCGAAGWTASRA